MSNADCAPSRRCAEPGFVGDDNKDGDAADEEVCAAVEEYEEEEARSKGGSRRILSDS